MNFGALFKRSSSSLSLLDQALVSGCNFMTQILLARFLGVEAYGLFTLIWMLPLFLSNIQNGLIVYPMMTRASQYQGDALQQFFSAVALQQVLLTLLSALLLGIALAFYQCSMQLVVWALFAVVGYQLQDFVRRILFVRGQASQAIYCDSLSYVGQLLGLVVLWWGHGVNLQMVFLVFALTSVVALLYAITILSWSRVSISSCIQQFRLSARSGKWLALSNVIQWTGSQGILSMAGIFLSNQALGGARAMINTTATVNIAIQGLQNSVPVKAAMLLSQNGYTVFLRYLLKWKLYLAVAFLLNALVVSYFREPLVILLYGKSYLPYAPYVILQAIYAFIGGLILPLTVYFRVLDKARVITTAYMIASFVAIGFAAASFALFKIATIFYGLLLNQTLIWLILLAATVIQHQQQSKLVRVA